MSAALALAGAAAAAVVLHFAYGLWSAATILRGLHLSNCGCFGVFWPRPLGWSTVLEDLVLMAASFGLAVLAPGQAARRGERPA